MRHPSSQFPRPWPHLSPGGTPGAGQRFPAVFPFAHRCAGAVFSEEWSNNSCAFQPGIRKARSEIITSSHPLALHADLRLRKCDENLLPVQQARFFGEVPAPNIRHNATRSLFHHRADSSFHLKHLVARVPVDILEMPLVNPHVIDNFGGQPQSGGGLVKVNFTKLHSRRRAFQVRPREAAPTKRFRCAQSDTLSRRSTPGPVNTAEQQQFHGATRWAKGTFPGFRRSPPPRFPARRPSDARSPGTGKRFDSADGSAARGIVTKPLLRKIRPSAEVSIINRPAFQIGAVLAHQTVRPLSACTTR